MIEFLALGVYAKFVHLNQNCGCFGFYETKIASVEHFVQNGILLGISVVLYFIQQKPERRRIA
jgi:hypothetical protein